MMKRNIYDEKVKKITEDGTRIIHFDFKKSHDNPGYTSNVENVNCPACLYTLATAVDLIPDTPPGIISDRIKELNFDTATLESPSIGS